MRKIMLLAAMLAMVLAAAAPALAQTVAIDEGDDVEYNAVCQNIIGAFGDITQTQDGDADAVAVDDSAAAAEVAQEQGVSIEQVNECLNNFATATATATGTAIVKKTVTATATATATAKVAAAAQYQYGVVKKTVTATATPTATALPETGGPASGALALGAGVLLVGGGLLARRIVR